MLELYKRVFIPYNQETLRSAFLSRWNFPPKESKEVIVLGKATTLVVASYANVDWGLEPVFNMLNLVPEDIAIYISQPGHFPPPHTDGSSSGQTREWALNFPLMNCDLGFTTWFNDKNTEFETVTSEKNSGTIYNKTLLKPHQLNELDRIRMDGAYMIRTNVLHSIDNRDNNQPRAVLTFRFKNTTWEQGKELLCQ